MFYEEEEINRLLKCEQCNQRYIQPRFLPCGESICTNCLKNLIEEQSSILIGKLKCCYCSEEHEIPERGFPISKKLEKLLETKPNEIYRSKVVEELATQLRNIKNELNALKSTLDNGIEKIQERCSLLKHQIQIKAESLIDQINKLSDEMQQEIDHYEKECIESFEKSNDIKEKLNSKINEGKSYCEKSTNYLCKFKIDEDKVLDLADEAEVIIVECKQLKRDLNTALFTKMQYVFEPNEIPLDVQAIGWIRRAYYISELDSVILNNKQLKTDLINLCKYEFASTSKWLLIYRASRDGRSAEAFHSKCDHKAKTLTIVKSTDGFIFGGYAGQAWDSSNQFKFDPNLIMFSLVNPSSESDLTFDWKSIKDQKGIFCFSNYGPTFVNKQENLSKPSLRISFDDNKSESYLSWMYPLEDKNKWHYLTSDRKFDWIELEVFCMKS
jgi:uncharacterized protein YutE (UPF0331/DUF86 family)